MEREELELVQKARNGESESFGVLYDKYMPQIYRFILIQVRSREDAEDITHQVFMSAWQKIETYELRGFPFSSWLYRIAKNSVVDHFRGKRLHVEIDSLEEEFFAHNVYGELREAVDQTLEMKHVEGALQKLDPEHREVIILKFINELSNKEIADILEKREGTIRVIQHRALKQLQKYVEELRHTGTTIE